LRTRIAQNKATAHTQDPEGLTQHPRLALEMMERELAAGDVETSIGKGQRRRIGLHPRDVGSLARGLPQHLH